MKAWLQADSCLQDLRASGSYVLDLFEVVLVLVLWHNRAAQGCESDEGVAGSDASPTDRTIGHNTISIRFFTRVCSVARGMAGYPLRALPTFYAETPFDDDGTMVSDRDAVVNLSEVRAPYPPRLLHLLFPRGLPLELPVTASVAHMRELQRTMTPLTPGRSTFDCLGGGTDVYGRLPGMASPSKSEGSGCSAAIPRQGMSAAYSLTRINRTKGTTKNSVRSDSMVFSRASNFEA